MEDQNSNKDLFGKLPDEILRQVIAFLPSETALETIFLSTRWRALWDLASVKQTSLNGIAEEVAGFVEEFEKADPLRRPRRLRLHLLGNKNVALLASLVPKNKLKLAFSFEDKQEYFSRPFGCVLMNLNHKNGLMSNSFVKTLQLNSVGFLMNDSISSIFLRFLSLERLEIAECDGLKSLRVEAGTKLASLTILDCPHLVSLHLKSPKLRSFRYRGKLPRIWPEHHFNLSDAMLDFRLGLGDCSLVSSDFDPALLTIKNSEVLTLCGWTFETLIWPLKETFKFYRMKELWWIGYSEEQHNTDSLIRFLKLCPGLERLFVTIDDKSYGQRNPSPCSSEKAITRQANKHGHLKVVKMEGFLNEENEIRLAKQIREALLVEPLFVSSSLVESPSPKHYAQIISV